MNDIFILAGEESGDKYGSDLMKELQSFSIYGIGGESMQKLNPHIKSLSSFNIMGFIDVFFALPKIFKDFFKIRKTILTKNPKACIFIDFPDFNLLLAKSLRKKGYRGKIIHYICPSIWAWRKKRIITMEKNLDLLLCIFPFEKQYFSKLNVKYIGNSLAFNIKTINLPKKYIGIFPGSRRKEILKNLPIQLDCIKNFEKNVIISIANKNHENLIKKITKKYLKNPLFDTKINFIHQLKFAIATSGTINLELALHKVPTIVTYKLSYIDLCLAKLLKINLPFYCIVNIIMNKQIFPELYGPNLTTGNLNYWIKYFCNEKNLQSIKTTCSEVTNILKTSDPNKKSSRYITKLIAGIK